MRKEIIYILPLVLCSCVTNLYTVDFSSAFGGDVQKSKDVSIIGYFDNSVINSYSMIENPQDLGTSKCIALLINGVDKKKLENEKRERIRFEGQILYVRDLNSIMPGEYGTINNRDWSGTHCRGEVVIFVKHVILL